MADSRSFGLWGALGGMGLLGGVAAFLALKPSVPAAEAPPDAAVSVCEAPREHDCTFYRTCVEANVACGPTGYALGFGERYCQRFSVAPLSPLGTKWADSVMLCLQRALLPYDQPERKSATCDEISEAAFDSHPACYTALPASICFLPPGDVLAVFDTIGADEVFAERTREQIQAVIATCTVQIAERSVAIVTPPHLGGHRLPAPPDVQDSLGSEHGLNNARAAFWRDLARQYGVQP